MKIENLKRLSKQDIDVISMKVLTHYNEKYFSVNRATPLLSIVRNLVENHSLAYDDSSYLGFGSEGSKILGCYLPNAKKILVDSALKNAPTKFNFVLGHELGHFVLHRKVIFSENENDILVDSGDQLFSNKRQLITDSDFIEWQANYFSSIILLPTDILIAKLIDVRKEIGLTWRGKIYVDNQKCTQQDYHETLRLLMNYFFVSKTVIEYRLKSIGLVDDNRKNDNSIKSIAEIINDIKNDD